MHIEIVQKMNVRILINWIYYFCKWKISYNKETTPKFGHYHWKIDVINACAQNLTEKNPNFSEICDK